MWKRTYLNYIFDTKVPFLLLLFCTILIFFNKMYGIRYEPHKYFVKNKCRFFSILFVWKRLYTVVVILKNLFCDAAHSMLLNAHAGLC